MATEVLLPPSFPVSNGIEGNVSLQSTADVNLNISTKPSATSTSLPSKNSDSRAHKILQYGSRHTIQNTGWTTRLSLDSPSRKQSFRPIQLKSCDSSFSARLPMFSIDKPTIVRLQPTPSKLGSFLPSPLIIPPGIMPFRPQLGSGPLQVLNAPPPCRTMSGSYVPRPTAVCFVPISAPVPTRLDGIKRINIPPLRTGIGLVRPQLPTMVISVPSMMPPGSIRPIYASGSGSSMITVSQPARPLVSMQPLFVSPSVRPIFVPGPCQVAASPPPVMRPVYVSGSGQSLVSVGPPVIAVSAPVRTSVSGSSASSMKPLLPKPAPSTTSSIGPTVISLSVSVKNVVNVMSNSFDSAAQLNKVIDTAIDLPVKPLQTVAVLPVKGFGANSNKQQQDLRILNTLIRINHGCITEVCEVADDNINIPPGLANGSVCNLPNGATPVSNVPKSNQICLDHIDMNGAHFGYHNATDGRRIRVACDTNGQRHSPYVLFTSPVDEGVVLAEVIVEVKTHDPSKVETIPEEADVSAVSNVFTFEPLFVSEQTLVPVINSSAGETAQRNDPPADDGEHYAYSCYLCPFASLDPVHISQHWVNVHLAELPYRCPHCSRTFFTSTRAQVHIQRQHPNSGPTTVAFQRSDHYANTLSYELDADGGENEDENSDTEDIDEPAEVTLERYRHLTTCFDNVFSCRKCSYQTKSASALRQHLKYVHVRYKPYFCNYCPPGSANRSFACDFDLKQHTRTVHPERLGIASSPGNTILRRRNNFLVQAEIDWKESWEELTVGGERWLQCRRCAFRSASASEVWPHVLRDHRWPTTTKCPSCSTTITITDDDRLAGAITCNVCMSLIVMGPMTSSPSESSTVDVLVCNICGYKTQGRGSMNRHIQYTHTKCRPFACAYCDYAAVERPKVKMHIAAHHPEQPFVVKECTEDRDQFRKIVNSLFNKLVNVQSCNGLRESELQVDDLEDSEPSPSATPSGENEEENINTAVVPLFTCESCHLETSNYLEVIEHHRQFHPSTVAANVQTSPALRDQNFPSAFQTIAGEHFKCRLCGYCCTDRSCMSRHVKYMHITARPHSCPYCSYNNVEKTKVRLHVRSHHPCLQRSVRTDHKLLEEMTWRAKQYYVRVDRDGQEVSDSFPGSQGSSDLIDNGNFTLGELSTEHDDIVDVRSTSDGRNATVITSTGVFHIGVNPVPDKVVVKSDVEDDDVEIVLRPEQRPRRQINSVAELDHNYSAETDDSSLIEVNNGLMAVKEEPMDYEYETYFDEQLVPEGQGSAVGHVSTEGQGSLSGRRSDTEIKVPCEVTDDIRPSTSQASNLVPSDRPLSTPGFSEVDELSELSADDSGSYDSDGNDLERLEEFDFPDVDEPAAKKLKIDDIEQSANDGGNFEGDDNVVNSSDAWEDIKVDLEVLSDPKIQMKPVVEVEDVLQIILAWQQTMEQNSE